MSMTRTTLRLDSNLKKAAERKALEEDTTLQAVFNDALGKYLNDEAKKRARKIVFLTHDLGGQLDNLTRDDFYPDPKE